jgi:hypothetical protein
MDKQFFEKVFSAKRMEKYFARHQSTEKALLHYQCNIELTETFYPCISVLEIALRNAINRELQILFCREDWYSQFAHLPQLSTLNKYILQAKKQIAGRKENISQSKIIAELTLGFWVCLYNAEYERILWKNLRMVFPNMPKQERQRKNIAHPLNRFRIFRNRVFHHEPIAWNLQQLHNIHSEILSVIMWMDKDISAWLTAFDRFENVCRIVEKKLK